MSTANASGFTPAAVRAAISTNGQDYTTDALAFVFHDTPAVHRIYPQSGSSRGGAILTVSGSGLAAGLQPRCRFGAAGTVAGSVRGSGQMLCHTPAANFVLQAVRASPAAFPFRHLRLRLHEDHERALLLAALLAVLIKLWVVEARDLVALPLTSHDDQLMLDRAMSLLSGDWLGPYNERTLIKGPFYSFWIAATFLAGIPLLLSQHLLYAAACAVTALALRPVLGAHRNAGPAAASPHRVLRSLQEPRCCSAS